MPRYVFYIGICIRNKQKQHLRTEFILVTAVGEKEARSEAEKYLIKNSLLNLNDSYHLQVTCVAPHR